MKLGVWPKTKDWVWTQGWLREFHRLLGERQASILVRMRGPILDPRWEPYPVDLDQIVLAYLSRGLSDPEDVNRLEAKAAS